MAIIVKHTKVSLIPDGDDTSLIRPSDWNEDHTLLGLGTMAEQNANAVAITGGTISGVAVTGYVPTTTTITAGTGLTGGGDLSANRTIALANTAVTAGTYGSDSRSITQVVDAQGRLTNIYDQPIAIANTQVSGLGTASTKDAGVALGVATLDAGGTVPLSQIPASIIGGLNYQGTWNASTNTPTLTSSVGTKGYYYAVSVSGTTNLNGITDWFVGDLAVFDGSAWQQIDNTDAVTSVNGKTGTVVLTNTDISGFGTMSTQNANAVAITGGAINGTTIGATTAADITGNTINANTKVVSPDYYAQSILGGNLRTSGGTSLVNWDGGGSGNVTINGGLLANPANKNVSLAPTGTGTVTVNPAAAGTINNMVIGGTTPLAITGTTITATTFSGSGASLTSIPNSALVNSAITINGNSTALGGSVSVGTVTSVAASAGTGISVSGSPITGSGTLTITNTAPDQTVALTAGTGISVAGTYPNFTVTNTAPSSGGTVTSVSGTTGRITSTGGTTPVIDLASGIATAGTTGSSTLIPVVTIDTYGRVTGITTASNPQGTVTSVTGTAPVVSSGGATPAISMAASNTTTNGYLTSTDWNTFNGKQAALVSGTNIKTINTNSILGSGDLTIAATPAGSTTQVQYNNAGAFAGSSSFTFDGTALTAPRHIGTVSVSGSGTQGAFAYGTLSYSDTNHLATFQTSVNSYSQVEIQNTNAGASASADMIVGNNNTTASAYYGDFGMNSGGWAGTGAFNSPNNVYLTATTGDLAIGTTTANAIRFAVNGSTTDSLNISSAGNVNTPNGIWENSNTINANYTIGTGNNAKSAGPMTIATGVTVTVPTGSTWVIV